MPKENGKTKPLGLQELRDKLVQDAVVRKLEVIGEAVKKISEDIRNIYKEGFQGFKLWKFFMFIPALC